MALGRLLHAPRILLFELLRHDVGVGTLQLADGQRAQDAKAEEGAEEEDISGYGHHASAAEVKRWRAMRDADRSLTMVIVLLGGAALIACVLRAVRRQTTRPEKIEAKCAV